MESGGTQCPVGMVLFRDDTLRADSPEGGAQCRLSFTPPSDLDTTLFDSRFDICDDADMAVNGKWVEGETPWPSRTWDTRTRRNEALLGEIAKVEMERIWGDGAISRFSTACVREYTNRDVDRARVDLETVTGLVIGNVKDRRDLPGLFGRLARWGYVMPMYVSVERKNPIDHTRRMLLIQQDGLLGVAPLDLIQKRDEHITDIATVFLELSVARDAGDARTKAESVVEIEGELLSNWMGIGSGDFLEYVAGSGEFASDRKSFAWVRDTLAAADFDLTAMYEAMGGAKFAARAAVTEHWLFRPEYVTSLTHVLSRHSIEAWILYARASMLLDSQQYTPSLYIEPTANIVTRHRTRLSLHHRNSPQKSSVHSAYKAWVKGQRVAHIEYKDEAPRQGMAESWRMPTHPIHRPRWRFDHGEVTRQVPRVHKQPGFLATARTDRGLDSVEGQIEHSIYRDVCAMYAWSMIPTRFEKLFLKTLVSRQDRDLLAEVVEHLREAMHETVEASWYSAASKAEMLAKIEHVHVSIGSPNTTHWFDAATAIDGDHDNLDEASMFMLSMLLREATVANNLDILATDPGPHGDTENYPFLMSTAVSNAYYNPQTNRICILGGIVGAPLYNPAYSLAAVYAHIGSIIGHELGHALDYGGGMLFDRYGNVRDWVAAEDRDGLDTRISCLVQQYTQRTRFGNEHDGYATLSENMADTYGLDWAYRAWLKHREGGEPTEVEVREFVAMYAQVWAEQNDFETDLFMVQYDTHSRPEFRVNTVLRNFTPFVTRLCTALQQRQCTLL